MLTVTDCKGEQTIVPVPKGTSITIDGSALHMNRMFTSYDYIKKNSEIPPTQRGIGLILSNSSRIGFWATMKRMRLYLLVQV